MQFLQLALHFDQHLGSAIAQHGTLIYVLLFAIICIEIGIVPMFFLPGDPLVFLCGAYCATGAIDVLIVAPVLFAATVVGSLLSYASGRALGNRVYTHDYRWLDKAALNRTHTFFEHHGGLTFLLSPFIAVVRTFAPFVAGVARMTLPRFASSVVAGRGDLDRHAGGRRLLLRQRTDRPESHERDRAVRNGDRCRVARDRRVWRRFR